MSGREEPYYRDDLALVHHRGFGFHADSCAPAILELLEPVRRRSGLVLEIGCGSGLLTRHLVDGGHRVVATDASPAMLRLAREYVPEAEQVRLLRLPDDPVPQADAVVSVGHALNYLPDEPSLERALAEVAGATLPGGVMILDLCDLQWGEERKNAPATGRVGQDWAIIHRFSVPSPDRFVRDMTTFLRNHDGSWRRDDERHENVLIDTASVPRLLERHGITASLRSSFGVQPLPSGLRFVVGYRSA